MMLLEKSLSSFQRHTARGVATGLVVVSLLSVGPTYGAAGFSLNWQPRPDARYTLAFADYITCNQPGVSGACLQQDGNDFTSWINPSNAVTPFLQESVIIGNQRYYHVIVGKLDANNAGFALEYYISALSCCAYDNPALDRYRISASAGHWHPVYVRDPLNTKDSWKSARMNGTGTANPERVLMRMRLTEQDPAAFSLDILKDQFSTKPKITQTTGDTAWTGEVQIDGSAIAYSNTTSNAPFINRVTLSDPELRGSGNFDMGTDTQRTWLSGGRYSYTPGVLIDKTGAPILDAGGNQIPWTGQASGREGAGGTYSYWDGFFNIGTVDWKLFRNPSQNP